MDVAVLILVIVLIGMKAFDFWVVLGYLRRAEETLKLTREWALLAKERHQDATAVLDAARKVQTKGD
jgi:hypothetical protein